MNMAMTKKRWSVVVPSALAALGSCSPAAAGGGWGAPTAPSLSSEAAADAGRPNILLIVIDDWGTDKSGLYSSFADDEIAIPTPTIDAIAAHGVRFANAWASPNCSPSRATLVTGQYPSRNGVRDVIEVEAAVGIDPGDPWLLPRLMTGGGYRTGMIGKWHLSSESDNVQNDSPLACGFDFWTGTNGSFGPDADNFPFTDPSYYVTPPIQCDVGVTPRVCAEAPTWRTQLEYQNETDLTQILREQYQPSYHVDQAINWINAPSDGKPWFMYLAFQSPHAPFVLPPKHLVSDELRARVEAKVRQVNSDPSYQYREGERFLSFRITEAPDPPDARPPTAPMPDPVLARAAYAAMVAAVDTEILRLLRQIDLRNTYVVVLGDNGTDGAVIDPDRAGFPGADANERGKGTLFQGGIAIPLIMASYDVVSPGRTSSSLVHSSDVYSTILELAGITIPDSTEVTIDGISVLHELQSPGDSGSARRVSWSDYGPNPPSNSRDNPNDTPWGYAIRDYRYKLMSEALYDETGAVQCTVELPPGEVCETWNWEAVSRLYDLLEDPTEQVDLLADGEAQLPFPLFARLTLLRLEQALIFHSFK
jgi:arylsulfatase A-like enzyme